MISLRKSKFLTSCVWESVSSGSHLAANKFVSILEHEICHRKIYILISQFIRGRSWPTRICLMRVHINAVLHRNRALVIAQLHLADHLDRPGTLLEFARQCRGPRPGRAPILVQNQLEVIFPSNNAG